MAKNRKKSSGFPVNLGTIVFLVIVIYLTVYVLSYLGKEKLAIYEVSESDISDSIEGTGVILREESLVSTSQEGYINYYVKDGSRVANHETVYTIDTTGKLQSYLKELLKEKNSVSEEEKSQIFEDLKTFSESFSDNNFSEIYETKDNINHDLMSYSDTIIADNKQKLEKKYGKDCYVEVQSENTGLVSFSSDGLEDLTEKSLNAKLFNQKVKMKDLRSQEMVSAGSPVYRMITSQKWKLILPLSKEEYDRLNNIKEKDIDKVQVTFNKDNFVTTASFKCFKNKKEYYVRLYFDNYVQRYLNQRYLSAELLLSETEGLKIPSSSLVTKDVYKIPQRFLTKGSNSNEGTQVNILTTNKKGEKILSQVSVSVYRTEGKNVLVTMDGLEKGDVISSLDKTDTFTLKDTSKLQGVFLVNRGYAVFKPVVILERNEDYCIISAKESNVELYDRIILNSGAIKENQLIY